MTSRYYVVNTVFRADTDPDDRALVIKHMEELPGHYHNEADAINNARTLSLIECVAQCDVFQVREIPIGVWKKGGRYEAH